MSASLTRDIERRFGDDVNSSRFAKLAREKREIVDSLEGSIRQFLESNRNYLDFRLRATGSSETGLGSAESDLDMTLGEFYVLFGVRRAKAMFSFRYGSNQMIRRRTAFFLFSGVGM